MLRRRRLLPVLQLAVLLVGRALAFAPVGIAPRRAVATHPATRLSAGAVAPTADKNNSETTLPPYPNLVPSSFGGIDYYSVGDTSRQPSDEDQQKKRRVYRTIFVLGGPGAGKGTQSSLVLENYPDPGRYVCHLSAGDLLREARASGGEEAELIESYIVAGRIVPVEVTLGLLKRAMDGVCDSAQSEEGSSSTSFNNAPPIFLIDGFPRSDDNLDGWEEIMGPDSALAATIVYDCPEEELERRLLERAKTSGRSDDNLESIRKRFNTFKRETEPVVSRLESSERCPVIHVDADRSIEEVWADTKSVIDGVVISDVLSANSDVVGDECRDIEGAEVRLLNKGERATVTYKRTDDDAGRVTERREWAFDGSKGGWAGVGVERVPVQGDA